jgi:hypothetical protein
LVVWVIAANLIGCGILCSVMDLARGRLAHHKHALNRPFFLLMIEIYRRASAAPFNLPAGRHRRRWCSVSFDATP